MEQSIEAKCLLTASAENYMKTFEIQETNSDRFKSPYECLVTSDILVPEHRWVPEGTMQRLNRTVIHMPDVTTDSINAMGHITSLQWPEEPLDDVTITKRRIRMLRTLHFQSYYCRAAKQLLLEMLHQSPSKAHLINPMIQQDELVNVAQNQEH